MWKATKGAADDYRASEGAHLFIDYKKWKQREPDFTLSGYNKSVVSINIVNVGRTPAILVDTGATANIKKIDYPTKEEAGMVNTIIFSEGVLIKTLGIEPISCQECIGPSVSLCNTSRHRENETGAFLAPLTLSIFSSISVKKTDYALQLKMFSSASYRS